MADHNKLGTFNIYEDIEHMKKKRKWDAVLFVIAASSLPPRKKQRTVKSEEKSREENFKELEKELMKYHIKKKFLDPELCLTDSGRSAKVKFSSSGEKSNCISPLFVEDLYDLLLKSVTGNKSPFSHRWVKFRNAKKIVKTVVVDIAGLSQQNVIELRSKLNQNDSIFNYILEIVSLNKPFAKELSSLHLVTDSYSHGEKILSDVFPTDKMSKVEIEQSSPANNLSKLRLLLSPIHLAMENYPLPQSTLVQSESEGYCFSKDAYDHVHENSPIFAVDCEMCRTVTGRQEVTRIAIVNEKLETVYHTLVKPKDKIVDYATVYSGITKTMLRNVKTTLNDVQNEMRRILPSDAILCGHSLNFDLHSLKMIHPYVIDSSVIFNEYGIRQKKLSLRHLAWIHLRESIQQGENGHNPIEDSVATMKLVQLKLKTFDAVLSETVEHNVNVGKIKSDSLSSSVHETPNVPDLEYSVSNKHGFFSVISKASKKVCLIGSEDSLSNYIPEIITDNVSKVTKSQIKKIITATSQSVENHDFVMSHLVSDLENCTIAELGDEMKQVYDNFPRGTLCMILLSGVGEPSKEHFRKNYCMIRIKK